MGTILDVAAGTGLVGEELKKAGFKVDNVTALDFSPEMLEVSRKKGVYGKLVESAFNTHPRGSEGQKLRLCHHVWRLCCGTRTSSQSSHHGKALQKGGLSHQLHDKTICRVCGRIQEH